MLLLIGYKGNRKNCIFIKDKIVVIIILIIDELIYKLFLWIGKLIDDNKLFSYINI